MGLLALWAGPGCYLSHGRGPADAGVPDAPTRDAASDAGIDAPTDAGPTCTFTFTTPEGASGACSIAANSTESCAEAALCVCAARGARTSSELIACAGWDLTPRGAITFTDFCELVPPERANLTEALEGFLGADALRDVSPACAATPALIGARPFASCGVIATELCRCIPDCDLDTALGRPCLELSPDHAACIERSIFSNTEDCAFATTLPERAARCE